MTISLSAYLSEHFVDKPAFARLCGVSVERLDALIEAKAIPAATYICDGNSIRSSAFGQTMVNEAIFGEFFRPENARWTEIANQANPGSERVDVISVLSEELQLGLGRYPSQADIKDKVQSFLPHFANGTFGLCVADPSTGYGIAAKEALQERLVEVSCNGTEPRPKGMTQNELLVLIDQYASAAMPFSPAEYERSSRKRLVDDFKIKVSKA